MILKLPKKAFGSYRNLVGNSPSVALQRLTGGKVDKQYFLFFISLLIHISDLAEIEENDLWKKIRDHLAENWIMGCSTHDNNNNSNIVNTLGIVSNHAYTLIDAQEVEGYRLLKIRNTWGHGEWYFF